MHFTISKFSKGLLESHGMMERDIVSIHLTNRRSIVFSGRLEVDNKTGLTTVWIPDERGYELFELSRNLPLDETASIICEHYGWRR